VAALEPPDDPAAEPELSDGRPDAVLDAAVRGLARLEDASEGLEAAMFVPRVLRAPLFARLLPRLAPAVRQELALIGLLVPSLGGAARAVLAAALVKDGEPAALAFLASLDAATLGAGLLTVVRRQLMRAGWAPGAQAPVPLAGDPRAWPVVQVLASRLDGWGSQGTYLVRSRGAGRFAVLGVVDNEDRGAVDGACAFDLDAEELAEAIEDLMTRGIRVADLAPAAAIARMRASIARCRALDQPLPLPVVLGEALLAGAEAAPRPVPATRAATPRPPAARAEAVPPALVHSDALLHTKETAGLRLTAADSPAAAALTTGRRWPCSLGARPCPPSPCRHRATR
jgi:hypothetical protein